MLRTYSLYRRMRIFIFSFILVFQLVSLSLSQTLLDAANHPKYLNPLPIPAQIDATQGGSFEMEMNQTQQWLGLVDPLGQPLMTTVWGYGLDGMGVTYPGPTFLAKRDVQVNVNWHNRLPGHFLPVDATLHMAHPATLHLPEEVAAWYAAGNVPAVTHLHGGHTESASDGLPEAWYTQNGYETGAYYVKQNYTYDNSQEAATLWYHDHALGITRLNVYAGLAGFYLLEDKIERDLVKNNVLPKGKHDIEVVIQDRMFDNTGQLFLPSKTGDPWFGDPDEPLELPYDPSIVAEFFGDFIVVNGQVWPYLSVEPRPYRFRLLNGSDSRFYVLRFEGDLEFLQIATDDGLLPQAVALTELIIAPGERAEIVVDFNNVGFGNNILLKNYGPDEPFKGITAGQDPADPLTTGQIMQFRVDQKLKVNKGLPIPTVAAGTTLRDPLIDLESDAVTTRKLALFEGEDSDGRLQPLLGVINGDNEKSASVANGSLAWFEEITENPNLNDVEYWEVYNNTEDAHPIHLHLVAFQIIERRSFTAESYEQDQLQHNGETGTGGYIEESSIVLGTSEPPAPNEQGWKDTFIVPPGYMGKVIAKFDRPGRYVWHCHILSHEDHEMMRPYNVVPVPVIAGAAIAGTTQNRENIVAILPTEYSVDQNYPNPFNPVTEIHFQIPEDNFVNINIYNTLGQVVRNLVNAEYTAGNHKVVWDGRDNAGNNLTSGIYFYRFESGNIVKTLKMQLIR